MEPNLLVVMGTELAPRAQNRIMSALNELVLEGQTITLTTLGNEDLPLERINAFDGHVLVLSGGAIPNTWLEQCPKLAKISSREECNKLVDNCPAQKMLARLGYLGIEIGRDDCEEVPPDVECTPGILGGPCKSPDGPDPVADPPQDNGAGHDTPDSG